FTFTSNLLFRSWIFGLAMCRVVSYAQAVSVFISAYTLCAMCVDRYRAIVHPLKHRICKRTCFYVIGFIWCGALLTPLPIAILSTVVPIDNAVFENSTKLINNTADSTLELPTRYQCKEDWSWSHGL